MPDRSHPDSAVLLALVDGELGILASWRVRAHLRRCWMCRGRAVELQHAIAAVGVSFRTTPSGIDGTAVARARWNFRQAVADFEAQPPESTRARLRYAGAFGALAIAALAVVGTFHFRPPAAGSYRPATTSPGPEFLTVAQTRELSPITAVREERFTVEISSSESPTPATRELRVLSAPRAGLHSARWIDDRGVLRHAVFAADAGGDALYSSEDGLRSVAIPRPARYSALYESVGVSTHLEEALINWIRKQAWEPISFAREAAAFVFRTGARLQIRRDGSDWVLTAEAPVDKTSVQLMLRVTENRPVSVLEIAWQTGSGYRRVRFHRDERRDYPTLASAPVWIRASALRLPSRGVAEPAAPAVAPGPPAGELLGAEVEVLAALHRAGLCSRDGIRISAGSQSIHLSGVLANDAERERIEMALRSIPRAALVTTDLHTVDLASVATVGISSKLESAEQTSHAAPAESWLRAQMGVGTRANERDMFTRMSQLVGSAEDVLANAWALEHLARHFPSDRQALLSEADRNLLITAVADHAKLADAQLLHIDGLLSFRAQSVPVAVPTGDGWQDQAASFRKAAQRFCDEILRLFASSATAAPAANPDKSELPVLLRQLRTWAPALTESLTPQLVSR